MPEHKESVNAKTVTRGTMGDWFLFFIEVSKGEDF
jgi:hypothetical protein